MTVTVRRVCGRVTRQTTSQPAVSQLATVKIIRAKVYNPMYNTHLECQSRCNDQMRLLQSVWLLF